MAEVFDEMTDRLQAFVRAQQMFFVASAPLSPDGHVNVSPKGLDSLRILSPKHVAYLDLTGSGNETSAHLRENGRITLMFCAFSGPPKILRLFGSGETVLPGSNRWEELRPLFGAYPGTRQIIDVHVTRVQTSCGYGVPLFDFEGQRDTMVRWANAKGPEGLQDYRAEQNTRSIDGLPTPLGLRG